MREVVDFDAVPGGLELVCENRQWYLRPRDGDPRFAPYWTIDKARELGWIVPVPWPEPRTFI